MLAFGPSAARMFFGLVLLEIPALTQAQTKVQLTDQKVFNAAFDAKPSGSLKCDLRHYKPFLDFSFSYLITYTLDCDLAQFGGEPAQLATFLRVHSSGGSDMSVFADRFQIPSRPHGLPPGTDLRRLHANLSISGAVLAGAGQYVIEILAFDGQLRAFRGKWNIKIAPRKKREQEAIVFPPGTVASVYPPALPPAPDPGTKVAVPHLTILMNAAPIYQRALKLRSWDRAFLLQTLTTLIRQFPATSVRVVAFNLDQQREIFRQEGFKPTHVKDLGAALRALELGTVSYKTLEKANGWASLLAGLVNGEASADPPSDVVVFLGPTTRFANKVPREMLAQNPRMPQVFYFEYYPYVGGDFPDSIDYLTDALNGKVIRLHSPAELISGIQKMRDQLAEPPVRR